MDKSLIQTEELYFEESVHHVHRPSHQCKYEPTDQSSLSQVLMSRWAPLLHFTDKQDGQQLIHCDSTNS